jgi:hypothetical protein
MRTKRRATIQDLRQAIDCLPHATRVAMLKGIRRNQIIAGAYSDSGGVCPMLAAHRAGARSDLISFARAWDRFVFRDVRVGVARRATDRELRILRTNLEASLLAENAEAVDLAGVVADHHALVARRRAAEAAADPADSEAAARGDHDDVRPGDPNRAPELRDRPGWAWTRVFRRHDEYQRALARLERERRVASAQRPRTRAS